MDSKSNLFQEKQAWPDLKRYSKYGWANVYEKRRVCSNCKVMYAKIDHWRANADNDSNPFLKPDAHMAIADHIAIYREDRDRRSVMESPQFTQDLFCRAAESQHIFKKEIGQFDHREISTENTSFKGSILGNSESVVRLHVGSKEPIRSGSVGNFLTSSSSLKISKLTSKMRALEKIASKHRRGEFGMPEKDFLQLVFCPYKGQGKKDKSELRDFLNFRKSIEPPPDNLELPVVAVGNFRKHTQSRQGGMNMSRPLDSQPEHYEGESDIMDNESGKIVDYSKYTDLFSSISQMKRDSRKAQLSFPEKHMQIQEPLPIKRSQKAKLTAVEPAAVRADLPVS